MGGARVSCPKCGREGRQSVMRFKAKGHIYYYLVVVHPDNKKCIIRRVEPPKRPSREEVMQAVDRLKRAADELKREIEELERLLQGGFTAP